jgi:hypothetical protein
MRAYPNEQAIQNVIIGERIPDEPRFLAAPKPEVGIRLVERDGLPNSPENRPSERKRRSRPEQPEGKSRRPERVIDGLRLH